MSHNSLLMKSQRFLMSGGAFLVYVLLLFVISQYVFSPDVSVNSSHWIIFGFSALASLVFLAVGIFVWFFARDRLIAFWLFCFCFAMMSHLIVMIGAAFDPGFCLVKDDSFLAAFICACLLLAMFPGREMYEGGRRFSAKGIAIAKTPVSRIYLRSAHFVLYAISAIGCVLLICSLWVY